MENGHEPATKQVVVDAVGASEERVVETMRDIQTEILKAFYSFAASNQARLTETERESSALKERMGILEQRLTDIERKVNFPNRPTQ